MTSATDDLSGLKDDMIAFIEGHGLRRFHGYVDYEEVQWSCGSRARTPMAGRISWSWPNLRACRFSPWIRGRSSAKNLKN